MSRVIMKNGDVVNLETYDWETYKGPIQLAIVARELAAKASSCLNDYPGHKVSFCFNSEFGAIPEQVRRELETLGVEVQTWP